MPRAILSIILLLSGGGFSAEAVLYAAPPATANEPQDDGWRRTARGWEHVSAWQPAPATEPVIAPPVRRWLGWGLILFALVCGVLLMLLEIDPVEQNAFRLRSRR